MTFNLALQLQLRDTVRRVSLFCLVISSLLLTIIHVLAQEAIVHLDYGQTVIGEISDASPEQVYQFEGAQGDVVAIEMVSIDRSLDNRLSEPVLILRSPSAEMLVDTTLRYDVDDSLLVAQLPEDGLYTVIATRDPNVLILAEGEFRLTLNVVEQLSVGDMRESTLNEDKFGQYIFVDSNTDWLLQYDRLVGEYAPEITVNLLNPERGGLELVAASYGTSLRRAQLGIFDPSTVYFIWIRQHPDAFDFGDSWSDYELRILEP